MARLADCADETEMEEVKRWGRVGGEREKERERVWVASGRVADAVKAVAEKRADEVINTRRRPSPPRGINSFARLSPLAQRQTEREGSARVRPLQLLTSPSSAGGQPLTYPPCPIA